MRGGSCSHGGVVASGIYRRLRLRFDFAFGTHWVDAMKKASHIATVTCETSRCGRDICGRAERVGRPSEGQGLPDLGATGKMVIDIIECTENSRKNLQPQNVIYYIEDGSYVKESRKSKGSSFSYILNQCLQDRVEFWWARNQERNVEGVEPIIRMYRFGHVRVVED